MILHNRILPNFFSYQLQKYNLSSSLKNPQPSDFPLMFPKSSFKIDTKR